MKSPTSYLEWIECFEAAKKGTCDTEVIECTKKGTLSLEAGVGGRIARELNEVIKFRMDKASKDFNRGMSLAGNDINMLVNSLIKLKKEFKFLVKFVDIPILPDDDIKKIQEIIKDEANKMQSSLEDSARNDRTGVLLSTIRRNKVNNLEEI